LIGFSDLQMLECSHNQLTNLILPVNNQIRVLKCEGNQLTNLPINLNPETLTVLDVGRNNFQSDLTIFSHLVNLETLNIGNSFSKGDGNQFTGSLVALANFKKLK
jgi:Leucine-rich repeat (LRR) protein